MANGAASYQLLEAPAVIQRDGLALLAGWLLTIACGLVLALIVGGAVIGWRHLV